MISTEELKNIRDKEFEEVYNEFMKIHPIHSKEGPGEDPYGYFKAGYKANQVPSGNQYSGYLKENNSTWNKVRPDEPVFILRGQDVTAPEMVLAWIAKNLDTVEEGKIKEAFQTVLAMRRYDSRRDPT